MSFPPKNLAGDVGERTGLVSPQPRSSRVWTALHFGVTARVSVDLAHDRPPPAAVCGRLPRLGRHTPPGTLDTQQTGDSGPEIV